MVESCRTYLWKRLSACTPSGRSSRFFCWMKTWYLAVCDEHKEKCRVMVSNPLCTHAYLADKSEMIQTWLELHYGCNLRLVHLDTELEKIEDYMDADESRQTKKRVQT